MPRLFVIFLMVKIILVPISNCHFLHSLELPSKLYCNLFQDYFFVYYCRNDLFARPFVFSSSKKLWTTLLKTWIWYIFFCNSYGYYFCRVESSWAISLLRRSRVSELFTKDLKANFGYGSDTKCLYCLARRWVLSCPLLRHELQSKNCITQIQFWYACWL